MDVNLKIAEALGIQILSDFEESMGLAEYPYICIEIQGMPTFSQQGKDGYYSSFWWSLNGPDSGNTRSVIENYLTKMGWDITVVINKTGCHYELDLFDEDNIHTGKEVTTRTYDTAELALIEAAREVLDI